MYRMAIVMACTSAAGCENMSARPEYERLLCWLQALKDLQMGNRILYVICAEGKANKNITIANLVSGLTTDSFSCIAPQGVMLTSPVLCSLACKALFAACTTMP